MDLPPRESSPLTNPLLLMLGRPLRMPPSCPHQDLEKTIPDKNTKIIVGDRDGKTKAIDCLQVGCSPMPFANATARWELNPLA